MSLDDYFGEIFFAGSHDGAAKAVFNGKADAAFVSENALSRAIDRGALELGSFNHLWVSPKVVSNPIVVNTNTMSPEAIAEMKGIMMGMVNDEAGRAALKTVKMAAMPGAHRRPPSIPCARSWPRRRSSRRRVTSAKICQFANG